VQEIKKDTVEDKMENWLCTKKDAHSPWAMLINFMVERTVSGVTFDMHAKYNCSS
jgi:hypothetical protein